MIDLTRPEHLLEAFIKGRCSLDPEEEVVFWWTGNLYSFIPGQKSQRLLRIEGYNIGRCLKKDDGYQFLAREVMLYKSPADASILEQWQNPLSQETVEVVHVWNDPVNQVYAPQGPYGPFALPVTDLGNGRVCISVDILLAYPSPLPRADYPRSSQSDLYQGAELFQFFLQRADIENADLRSIPCEVSWTRLGPWLPWMEMADRPGTLLYQCRGCKLARGYADLAPDLRAYVEVHHPEYRHAPTEFTRPNETSWTYFKKLLVQRGC